jgi:cytochrome oxidase Cu insertion factor (SCO1/SenC/PrrC family)
VSPRRHHRSAGGALALLLVLAAGCDSRAAESEQLRPFTSADADAEIVFGEVDDFSMVDQAGGSVTHAHLLGRPWVAATIFTTCTGPCPRVSASMRDMQSRLADVDMRLVSISVDPDYDTPEVLARYAEKFDADPERWMHLTGVREDVYTFIMSSLRTAVDRAPEEEAIRGQHVTHDSRLVAVDRHGRVRGYYASDSRSELDRLEARIRFLADEE